MSFKRRIKYFLVHTLMLSNKEAGKLIENGSIEIDGVTIHENCILEEQVEIKVNGKVERKEKKYVYLKFHKPPGFESTLKTSVPDNIAPFFKEYENLFIAGRLDKQSEGLMLLSNNGKWVEFTCNPKFEKEKEYIVSLDKLPDNDFFTAFRNGLKIGNFVTAPCICEPIEGTNIRVILREGKNRQIRRMCKNLGYQVTRLVRVRIGSETIENLKVADVQDFSI